MKYFNIPIHNVLMTLALIHLLACSTERTDLQLANLFSDNMVLQQKSANPIWGIATAGTKLKVSTSWGEEIAVTASNDGKWMTKISTPDANGKSQTITFETHDTTIVLNNVLAGEVWLCSGQSNMEMPLKGWLPRDPLDNSEEEIANASYSAIRMFTVKRNKSFSPLDDVNGAWEVCTPEIAPLIPYSIKGAIWYQGESNRDKPTQYHTLFPAVFNSWRSNWGIGDFPFYYVQLASFTYNSDKVAELREAQLETLKEKNVGMAVTMDIGSLTTIHPPNKQDVGKRLALWALAKDYSKEELVYSGPLFKSVDFKDDKAVVSFDHIGQGLYSPDQEVSHFELAGDDLIFHPASAFIKDNKVIAQSSNVQKPTIVRYGWSATAMPNLFNKEGLPASPFRSSKRIHLGPEEVYPSQNVEIKYHSDWTKDHYPSRIDEFRKDPLNYGDIVFLGNSITESGRDWGQKLGLKNVKNRSISGDVTDGVLKRLDEITHFKAKAVFILIGINDLSNLYYQKKIPSAEYVGNNILKITESINNKSPKTQIYLQTVLPNANEEMRESINIVNTIIKSNEPKGRYKVIDLHKKFKGEDGLMKSELTTDGVHLNKTGYDLWVSELKLFIN